MNTEKDSSNGQHNADTMINENLPSNHSKSGDQGEKAPIVGKIHNKTCMEQLKLNNNLGKSDIQSNISPNKSTIVFSNGSESVHSNSSHYCNSLHQAGSQDVQNTNLPSAFMNTLNVKSPTGCSGVSSQAKNKTVTSINSLSMCKQQLHLNVSSNQTNYFNHAPVPVAYNSSSVSFSSTTGPQNLPMNTCNEDTDMKNNVDYVSGIEKCPSKVSCSSDSSPESEHVWSSNTYTPQSALNNIGGSIGSTSQGTCCFLRPNINGSREMAGPSGLQKSVQREQVTRRDSSSGNEGDMSDGEDYCIYTYRGNDETVQLHQNEQLNQGQMDEHGAEGANSGRSSPEMDFLEMDFDPGPSCEQDTGDSDLASINEDIQNLALDNVEPNPELNDLSSGKVVTRHGTATQIPKQNEQNVSHVEPQPCSSRGAVEEQRTTQAKPAPWTPSTSCTSGTSNWLSTNIYRSTGCPLRESYRYHNTSGDLISPGDSSDSDTELWAETSSASIPENSNSNSKRVNLSSTLYHRMMAKKLMLNKQAAFNQSSDSNLESELCNERLDGLVPIEKVMLWSEKEATVKQVTQVATSACGATAAINALLALEVPFSMEVLMKSVTTRLREPGTPLPRYLRSRSVAGSTHKDMARGISLSTSGAVITKFFAFYPERKVSLSHWLHYWISREAAPIATLNLQHCEEGSDIPDAWHHQMIFGVGPAGIYLTNPLECLSEQFVWHQLVSPSVLLIRRADVLAHWNANTDLTPLARMDHNWRRFNVLGQVVNMVREAMSQRQQATTASVGASHIRIPAAYQAGIMLVMRTDSPAANELARAEQLPLI